MHSNDYYRRYGLHKGRSLFYKLYNPKEVGKLVVAFAVKQCGSIKLWLRMILDSRLEFVYFWMFQLYKR